MLEWWQKIVRETLIGRIHIVAAVFLVEIDFVLDHKI